MKKTLATLFLATAVLFALCCGKKGPIYPPLVNIPKPIEEFIAVQKGAGIILNWNNPSAYIDGSPLEEITRVEVWLFIASDEVVEDEKPVQTEIKESVQQQDEEESQVKVDEAEGEPKAESVALTAESFAEEAKLVTSISKEQFVLHLNQTQEQALVGAFVYTHPIPSEDLTGKTYTFALKAWAKKKESDFSAMLSVKPKALPFPPTGLKAEVLEDKIQIEWTVPEKNIDSSSPAEVMGYTVYRRSKDKGIQRVSTGLIKEAAFSDLEFQFDKTYTYTVRASASESSPFLESDDSEPLEIVPKDTFPPKMPQGLVAVPGDDFVSLSWDTNREPDLAGYRIWRKSGDDEEFTAISDLIRENVYNDSAVIRNSRYDYAVSAVDKTGNESQKSKSISVVPGRGLM
jgi:hypothetical protein